MLARPEAVIVVLVPFAPLFSHRVWLHAQRLLLAAMLDPTVRAVTASLRGIGLGTKRKPNLDNLDAAKISPPGL